MLLLLLPLLQALLPPTPPPLQPLSHVIVKAVIVVPAAPVVIVPARPRALRGQAVPPPNVLDVSPAPLAGRDGQSAAAVTLASQHSPRLLKVLALRMKHSAKPGHNSPPPPFIPQHSSSSSAYCVLGRRDVKVAVNKAVGRQDGSRPCL